LTKVDVPAVSTRNANSVVSTQGPNSAYTTGKFTKKLRASTVLPLEHKLHGAADDANKTRPVKVVSLDTNCQTCAPGNQNEAVMKAFKLACLQYKPSPVIFEQTKFKREELIAAKNQLLKYCLSQLKHLDLGLIDRELHVNDLNGAWVNIQRRQEQEGINFANLNPSKIPLKQDSTGSRSSSNECRKVITQQADWLNQDSIESFKQASGGFQSQSKGANRANAIRFSAPQHT